MTRYVKRDDADYAVLRDLILNLGLQMDPMINVFDGDLVDVLNPFSNDPTHNNDVTITASISVWLRVLSDAYRNRPR